MHDHIQRLKLKIREMEVATLANEARLKASEDRLEHQQRIIDGNVVLLELYRRNILMHRRNMQTVLFCYRMSRRNMQLYMLSM
jgi:hypothetical protein